MPFTYAIHPRTQLVLTVASGLVTDAELKALAKAQLDDPALPIRRREFCSLEGVTEAGVTRAGLQALVEHDLRHVPRHESYRLTIAAPTDVSFGLARMYQLMVEPVLPECSVFREQAEALRWLEASPEEIEFIRGILAQKPT
ncbi:MAG: hypothetical protein AMXMBFR7_34280 [Planctomycetota bacterium]